MAGRVTLPSEVYIFIFGNA